MTQTNPIDVVNAAVQAALAKAQATQAPQASHPMVATVPSAPPAVFSAPRTLTDALNSAGTAADVWLSVNEYGLYAGDKKVIFPHIMVQIDLTKVRFGQGVRWTLGNQTHYAKSWDLVRESQTNEPWAEVVAKARGLDGKCRGAYDLADIPMLVTEDVTGNALPGADPKSDRVIHEGVTLGYTTSITGYAPFMSFVRAAVAAHGQQAIVNAKVTGESKVKGGNSYGVMKFELLA